MVAHAAPAAGDYGWVGLVKEHFWSVFWAYMIGWGVFFFYYVSVTRRTAALGEQIERLKNSLSRGK